jgi:hypothetical protein
LAAGDFNLGSNVSLAKIKQDQKLIEENEKLKTEKEVLLENYKALELKVEQTAQELQVGQWLWFSCETCALIAYKVTFIHRM